MLILKNWLGPIIALCLIIGQNGYADSILKSVVLPTVHQKNLAICAQVIEKIFQNFPSSYTPQQCADSLCLQLDQVAQVLLIQGLDLNAYFYEKCENSPFLQFARISLWEGKSNPGLEIPLTLFIYVWPPENVAQQVIRNQASLEISKDPRQNHYATNIHGHPLPCALTVLRGTLCQENYEALKGWSFNVVQLKNEETLQIGKTEWDDNRSPFVHRIVCRDSGPTPAISLHGYGASSAEVVRKTFISNYEKYCYPYLLKENGQLSYQLW